MKTIKNYLFNLLYNIISMILPLVLAPYLSHVLGKDGIGTYAYYLAIAQYFTLFAKLGLTNYGTRRISQIRDDLEELKKVFSSIYAMQVTATILVASIYFAIIPNMFPNDRGIVMIFGVWIIGIAFNTDWMLFGLEKFKITALKNTAVKIIEFILVFILVKDANDIWKYCLITSAGYAIGFLTLWVSTYKYINFRKISIKKIICHIKPCLILMIPVIALNVYRSMDKVMLGTITSMGETGLYENAEKIIYCLTQFIYSLGQIMMPKMTNLYQNKDFSTIKKNIRLSIIFISFLTCGMSFGLICVSKSLVLLFYGNEFAGSISLLRLLAITIIPIGWGNVIRMQYVIPSSMDKVYIGSITIGAVVNIIINAILIPFFGAVGACIGTIFAETSVVVYQYFWVKRELEYKVYVSILLPFVVFGVSIAVEGLVIDCFMSPGLMTLMVEFLIGCFTYVFLAYIYMRKVYPVILSDLIGKLRRKQIGV